MDEKQMQKFIGYAVLAIIAFYFLQMILPFLILGVIGWVIWRAVQEYQKYTN